MNRVLQPILHKDAYTRAIEDEILAWLNEAVFAPIALVMHNYRVPMSPQYQAIKFDETGRENAVGWIRFPPTLGSLGLERGEMPQIRSEARGALVQFLAARGVTHLNAEVLPGALHPTQAGYYEDKLETARQVHREGDRSLLVPADHYILDGHHQWFADLLDRPEVLVKAIIFDEPIRTLLQLVNEFPSVEHLNAAAAALIRALQSNRVHYADGVFSGRFNAEISKELREIGAAYRAADKTFRLAEAQLPDEVKAAVASSLAAGQALHQEIGTVLDAIQENIAGAQMALNFNTAMNLVVRDLGQQFSQTTEAVEGMAVAPQFTPVMRQKLTAELTENLNLGIKNFAAEKIPELRRLVEENVFDGARSDRLAKILEANFGIAKRKADFLADQETGLLVSKYRQLRYESSGITDYVWSTSHDARVRDSHRALDGKRFQFASPPVTTAPGEPARRNNPGEDYRCRCVAKPILVYAEKVA